MHAPCPVVVAHEDDMAVHREIVVGVGTRSKPPTVSGSPSRMRRCVVPG
jgi:hypothetical protein